MLDKTLLLLGEAAPLLVSKAARREGCIGVVSRCAHLLSFTRLCRIIRHLGSGIVWQPPLYSASASKRFSRHPERGPGRDLSQSNRRRNRATVEFPATQSKRQSAREIICMGAYKGHFSIICAVCMRLIQPGKEGSETIVGVCDDCRTQSQIEGKRHQARQPPYRRDTDGHRTD